MSKRTRLFLVLLVLVICGAFLYPTYDWYFQISQDRKDLAAGSREQIRTYSESKAIKDLIVLKELVQSKPDAEVPEDLAFLIDLAKAKKKELSDKTPVDTWNISEVLKVFRSEAGTEEAIESYYRDDLLSLKSKSEDILKLGLDLSGGMSVLLEADQESLTERLGREPSAADLEDAIDRAMEVLNNRIDQFGVTEPQIRKQGDDEISIEVPGAADPDRVNSFLMGKGRLGFHIVDEEASQAVDIYRNQNANASVNDDGTIDGYDDLPAGSIIRGYYKKDQYGIDEFQRYVVIQEEVGLEGDYIQSAMVSTDPFTGKPNVTVELSTEGGDIFYKLTSNHVDEPLATVLDDRVRSIANISEGIRANVAISGFGATEAQELALVLRTGAMPVDLKVVNLQSIGASLGEDSITSGIRAILLGLILVVGFMFLYYLRAGLIADLALVLNFFIILAILSAFRLTLTLTSIAGLILTVGMAVDANVIIFERIKEEYRLGKTPVASVSAGFKKAFWTVMDANITTFIAAIFLSQIGSGPIQGFAYTLAVGIVSSMFTALFVSHLVFDFNLETLKVKKLSIGWRV